MDCAEAQFFGKSFRPGFLLKLRTMASDASARGLFLRVDWSERLSETRSASGKNRFRTST